MGSHADGDADVRQHDPDRGCPRAFAASRADAVGPQPRRWSLPGWADEDGGAFDKAVASQEIFLRAYYAAGGPLLTGSDVGPDFIVPGLAVHQEMARFVSMGVTPIDALRAATINGARALGISDRAGALAPGRWGDLLIVEADPLADITATQRIRTVVRRGRVVHDMSRPPGSR